MASSFGESLSTTLVHLSRLQFYSMYYCFCRGQHCLLSHSTNLFSFSSSLTCLDRNKRCVLSLWAKSFSLGDHPFLLGDDKCKFPTSLYTFGHSFNHCSLLCPLDFMVAIHKDIIIIGKNKASRILIIVLNMPQMSANLPLINTPS